MPRVINRRPRWWIAVLQAILLLATMVAPVSAATEPPPLTGTQLIQMLRHYDIIRGDETGNLNLDKPITRAEMITIMVRALGAEETAKLYAGFVTFQDVARGHWAEGNIAYATVKQLVKGDGDGRVRPQDNITYAEALTLILRVVGKEPTSNDWPVGVIVTSAELGIMPEGVTAVNINQPAVRGLVFQSMAKAVVTVKGPDGRTHLQTYVDTAAPTLAVARPAETTKDASVVITGTVDDAQFLSVNGRAINLTGRVFSTTVNLEYGLNTILVVASDYAGNSRTEEVKITRVPPIASLEIDGPSRIRIGGTASYTVTAKDSSGTATTLAGVAATVDGNIGTFDLATGRFTAANQAGKGKITVTSPTLSKSIEVEIMGQNPAASGLGVRPVNAGLAVAFTRPMTVQVEVRDVGGNFIDSDYGRPVTLTASGLSGLSVSPAVAYTDAGVATFTVTSNAIGFVSLQAQSASLTSASQTAQFGSNLRVRLTADNRTVSLGGSPSSARIQAQLVDENGAVVTNQTANDIFVTLSLATDNGILMEETLVIARGRSISDAAATYNPGAFAGSVTILGSTIGSSTLTVDPVTISVTTPTIGTGTTWDMLGSTSHMPNTPATLAFRVMDNQGSTVPGSYAFQIRVATSNNDPENVTVTLGTSGLNPVSDGIPEGADNDGNDVVARTVGGVASIQVNYNKPGQVYLTMLPMEGTNTAYAPDGTVGAATSSRGIAERTFTLTYGGTATGVSLSVDSALGQGQQVGAASTSIGKTYTLRVRLIDSAGNWVPTHNANVTLVRESGTATTLPATTTVATVNGQATFTVTTTNNVGLDEYRVTAMIDGTQRPSNTVQLYTQNAAPTAPIVLAARGIKNTIPGVPNLVAPDDTGLEIELAQNAQQSWVVARVYREGHSSPVWTSAPIYVAGSAPRIVVPKSSLPSGVSRYQITFVNGHGESQRSALTDSVTNSTYVSNISLSSAKYQRSTRTVILYGSGFWNANDTVNPGLITISDTSTGASRTFGGAQVTVNTAGQITLNLSGSALDGLVADLGNPGLFSGNDVRITAGAGWYTRMNGEQSAAITTGAAVNPMAHVTHAVFDRANRRLQLVGQGFTTGNLNTTMIKLKVSGSPDIALSTFGGSRNSDTLWTFTLTQDAADKLTANGGYVVALENGWFADGTFTQGPAGNVTIYTQVALSNVTYDSATKKLILRGSGFTGATISMDKLWIADLSTSQAVTLTGTYTVVSDTEIAFTLDSTAYSEFENLAKFQGSDIYLRGQAAWLRDLQGRYAAEIPDRALRLPDR